MSNRVDKPMRRDADIAVRLRPGLFAHEGSLARFGEPTAVRNVSAGVMTGFDRERRLLATQVKGAPGAARPSRAQAGSLARRP